MEATRGVVMVDRMTFGEARAKLRKYYRTLEIAEEYNLKSTDIIIAIGGKQKAKGGSLPESMATRKVDLLSSVRETGEAIQRLPEDHQKFIQLRYGMELGLRQTAREMFVGRSTAHALEKVVLASFIAALGKIPEGS